MTLTDLAQEMGDSLETLQSWIDDGMPECVERPGRYDFAIATWWSMGRVIRDFVRDRGKELSPAHTLALGWCLTPGPETNKRHEQFSSYLNVFYRSGIEANVALAALHDAVAILDQLEQLHGRDLDPDGRGRPVSTH